jgi:hypothetical protein
MEDDAPLNTYSPSHKTKVKKKVLIGGGGKWITGAIQTTILWSINFDPTKNAAESDITEAVSNWELKKVDLEKIMAVATKNMATAMVLWFATLKDKVVNQVMNAISIAFEEIKAGVIVIMLRKKAMGTLAYLVTWRKDKQKMEKLMDMTA